MPDDTYLNELEVAQAANAALFQLEDDEDSEEYSVENTGVDDGSVESEAENMGVVEEQPVDAPVAEETVETPTDTITDVMVYDGAYTNVFARALHNISRVFGEDTVIGEALHRAAATIELQFGDPEVVEQEYGGSAPVEEPVTEVAVESVVDESLADADASAVADSELTVADEQQVAFVTEGIQPESVIPSDEYVGGDVDDTPSAEDTVTTVVLDSQTEAVRNNMESELLSGDGGSVSQVDIAQTSVELSDSAVFVAELQQQADAVTQGEHAGGIIHGMDMAVSGNAVTDPVTAGQAIEAFGLLGEAHIRSVYEPGSGEYLSAMRNLDVVTADMTQSYYTTLLTREQTGQPLTAEELTVINGLQLPGVAVPYSEFTRDMDITIPLSADAADASRAEHDLLVREGIDRQNTGVQLSSDMDVLRRSDDKIVREISDTEAASNAYMANRARDDVINGFILNSADIIPGVERGMGSQSHFMLHRTMETQIRQLREANVSIRENYGDGSEGREIMADNYMTTMRGLQAYNDAAVDQIRTQYADDPEALARATYGLSNNMRAMVGDLWTAYQNDDDVFGFLSEEDIAELDAMQLTGVNVSYSEYRPGMDLKTGEMPTLEDEATTDMSLEDAVNPDNMYSESDLAMYGFVDVPSSGSWAVESLSASSGAQTRSGFVFIEEKVENPEMQITRNSKPFFPPVQSLAANLLQRNSATPGSRGAAAEALFGGILESDRAAQRQRDESLGLG